MERGGPLGKAETGSAELDGLEAELAAEEHANGLDPFLQYLYGLVLSDLCAARCAHLGALLEGRACCKAAWQHVHGCHGLLSELLCNSAASQVVTSHF